MATDFETNTPQKQAGGACGRANMALHRRWAQQLRRGVLEDKGARGGKVHLQVLLAFDPQAEIAGRMGASSIR